MTELLLGDLHERADGGFDGWCWAPERPSERLIVDLLVNDTVAASMVAAIFRRDLTARGYGDGHHGFVLRLPPNLPELAQECVITTRERRSGVIFGRLLRAPAVSGPVGGERLEQAARAMAAAWQDFAAARDRLRREPASTRLRPIFAALAARLAAGPGPRVAAAPLLARPFDGAGLPPGPMLVLPECDRPRLSLLLPVHDAAAALRQIAALAPGLAVADAEIVVVDAGSDPLAALLPARVRNLRYVRAAVGQGAADALNLALAQARGERLAVLGDAPPAPSVAAVLALVRLAAAHPGALLFGPAACDAAARVGADMRASAGALPARLGLWFCLSRAQWEAAGPLQAAVQDAAALECADLALRARLLGIDVLGVAEPAPWPAPVRAAPPASPAAMRGALAAFHERWGAA